MIRATTAMDEIRKLISQFESAVRRYGLLPTLRDRHVAC